MSFNCFPSTSREREIPAMRAESSAMDRDKVGILFVISIDSTIVSAPFADTRGVSFFAGEAETLFSMLTVFRIHTTKPMDAGGRPFEIYLNLTNDDDIELRTNGYVQ